MSLPLPHPAIANPPSPTNTKALTPKITPAEIECVVLLHGLARTTRSMRTMEQALQKAGYLTANLGYPSREHPIETLAETHIPPALAACRKQGAATIHFVTHSMGGILLRQYLATHGVEGLGRAVMLSPPSQGSETVDTLADVPGFEWLNGPAGGQLGTGDGSVPLALGKAWFEVGVITGTRSINPILSWIIPGPDDGKVAVERARLEGMADFLSVPHAHPFIMSRERVIQATIHFLRHGRFLPGQEERFAPGVTTAPETGKVTAPPTQ